MSDSNQWQIDSLKLDFKMSSENLNHHKLLKQLSPVALAYIGDAVYELYIRSLFLLPPKRIVDYHNSVVTQVKAETQAVHLQHLEPYLTSEEKEIVRRGRNAATSKPRRLSASIYQRASSLETLIGYLYLSDRDRLEYLLTKLNITPNVNG